jgi:DNA-directed RNA polymerase specialized sigma subunit
MPSPRKLLTAHGRSQTASEWQRELGLCRGRLYERLKSGMTLEEALTSDRFECHVTRRYAQQTRPTTEAYAGARDLPWAEDRVAQRLVSECGPLSLEDIARIQGCSREYIRQIEERALRKLRIQFTGRALHGRVMELLAGMDEERSRRQQTWPAMDVEDAA